MTKFRIKKEILKSFIEKTACNGVIKFRENTAVKQPLFSCFFLKVEDGKLEVLTIDTIKKKVRLNSIISGVEVIESGTITISDYEAILDVLKGRGLGKDPLITVWDEGDTIFIESDKDGYEIRQRENKEISKVSKKKKYLEGWRKAHKENKNGIIIMTMKDPKTGEIIKLPYPTKIEVKKEDLLKLVDDTINLTKDNKTKISLHDGVLKAFKGEANARTKGKHILPYEDIGSDLIEFEEDFYNIQTIVPNLFDKIVLNIRRIETNNSIAICVKSMDEKTKTELFIGLTSII